MQNSLDEQNLTLEDLASIFFAVFFVIYFFQVFTLVSSNGFHLTCEEYSEVSCLAEESLVIEKFYNFIYLKMIKTIMDELNMKLTMLNYEQR